MVINYYLVILADAFIQRDLVNLDTFINDIVIHEQVGG